jgi:HEPN domain-containing protein
MNDKLANYAKSWLRKAENDLRNAEIILDSKANALPYDTVCFHCQQAGEKYLKGFLAWKDMDFPHSHNLSDMIILCAKIDEVFNELLRPAETLTPFAVEIRYPDDLYMPSEKEAREAFLIAKQIRQIVLEKLPKTILDI